MELRCQRKGSVSYGLGADFSLPHCLVGDKVSENIAEPSPTGVNEPRAEISWCIVMVQRSGKVSRATAVGCVFLSAFSTILILRLTSRPKTSWGKKRFIHVPCHVLVKLSTGIVYNSWLLKAKTCSLENITSINTFTRREDCNIEVAKIKGLFHRKFLRESGEIFGKMSGNYGTAGY